MFLPLLGFKNYFLRSAAYLGTMNVRPAPASEPIACQDRVSWPVLIVACLVTVLVATAVAAYPKSGAPVAILYPPSTPISAIFQRVTDASGYVVDFGNIPGIAIAISDDPAFTTRMWQGGGVLLLDGALTSALCLTPSFKDQDL